MIRVMVFIDEEWTETDRFSVMDRVSAIIACARRVADGDGISAVFDGIEPPLVMFDADDTSSWDLENAHEQAQLVRRER